MSEHTEMLRPPRKTRVLTYGRDEALLDTRCRLLNWAGLEAETVTTTRSFHQKLSLTRDPYGLCIVCHTVPRGERQAIHAAAEEHEIPLYQLECFVDPADFLKRVAALTDIR